MTTPKDIRQAKSASAERKKRETAIHRVIDGYEQGRGASACMADIMRILKRKTRNT